MSKTEHSQNDWDDIVIGSGIGGLTHSFSRNGFTWDVGIHYMGEFAPGDPEKDLLDWLCTKPTEFASMGAVYDTLHVGDSESLRLSRPYEAHELDFKTRFPAEAEAVERWTDAMRKGREALMTATQVQSLPTPFGAGLKCWKRNELDRWRDRTTNDVARSLIDNDDLVHALTAQWGDYGGRPSTASFALRAMAVGSYLESGAWYPVGGGAVFAQHILPTISAGSGEAHAGAKVTSLLMEDGRFVGVTIAEGEAICADTVVSNIGARDTVECLLSKDCGHQDWIDDIRALDPNVAH